MANWSSATLLERLLELLAADDQVGDAAAILDEPDRLDTVYPTGGSLIEFLKDRVIDEAMKGRAHVSRPTPKKRTTKPKAPKVETKGEDEPPPEGGYGP